jgi:hypothetical protein
MALGPEDLAAAANVLKTIYSPEELMLMLCMRRPFMAAIVKSDDFEGDFYKHTVQHGFNQSAGPTPAVAIDTYSTNADARFSLERKRYYGYGKISREVMLATRSDKGSVTRKYKQALDGMIKGLGRYLDFTVWSDGGGAYGRLSGVGVASGLLATQVRLANLHGAIWIEPDQKHQFSVNTGFGGVQTVRQPGGGAEAAASTGITLTVANVNTRTGVITYTGAVPVAAGEVTVNDYVFRTRTKGLVLDGVRGWCPMDDTTAAAAFLGATRSVNIDRLSGQRWLDPLATYVETIREACAYASTLGNAGTSIFINPMTQNKIENSERDKVFKEEIGDLEIGFQVTKFQTPLGELDMMADPAVPPGWAFVTDPKDWSFKHLGKMVGFFEEAGLLRRVHGEDNYDFEGGGYGNILTDAPGNSLWIKLDKNAQVV